MQPEDADHSSPNDMLKPLFSSRPDFSSQLTGRPANWKRRRCADDDYKVEYQNKFLGLAAAAPASPGVVGRLESHQLLGQASLGQAASRKAFEPLQIVNGLALAKLQAQLASTFINCLARAEIESTNEPLAAPSSLHLFCI